MARRARGSDRRGPRALRFRLTNCSTDVILQHLDDPPTCSSPLKEKVALLQHVYRTNPRVADNVKAELIKDGAAPVFDVEHMREQARLTAEVVLGHVGLVLGLEVSRLARNNADWAPPHRT